jgi:dynein heavy chain 2, cytosolic
LNDYLEEKRQKFSRFYFIGDEDLLEILGQSKNPTIIQLHLKKLFAGIHKVDFGKNNTEIKAMISSVGEYVPLSSAVVVQDDVEIWLGDLEKVMRTTLDN